MYVHYAPSDSTGGHNTDTPGGDDDRRDDAVFLHDLDATDGTEIASVTLDDNSDSDVDFDSAPRDPTIGATLLVDVRDSQPKYDCRSDNDNCPGPNPDADCWLCFDCYQRVCESHGREAANEVLDRQLR